MTYPEEEIRRRVTLESFIAVSPAYVGHVLRGVDMTLKFYSWKIEYPVELPLTHPTHHGSRCPLTSSWSPLSTNE